MSQAFPVNVVGISNRLSVMRDKDRHYEFVVHTTWSRVSPTDSILAKLTTIDPQYVVCNETSFLLLLCQDGFQDRQVEVLPPSGRLPWYWTDAKAQQRIQFKFGEQDAQGGFDDETYEWSRQIKPSRIGRTSIRCRSTREPSSSKHILVIKQVNKETQTVYVILREEDENRPTYKIENLSKSVTLMYFQQGLSSGAEGLYETLAPGESSTYSWIDPERPKGRRTLCCHLDMPDSLTGGLKTEQKLEVDLENAEFSQTFAGPASSVLLPASGMQVE